ncbi:hypothetical protein DFH06DRAFT_1428669 [Mycena polygramma]|nr:hypothetical protein DFH06DRAFT_1428669 [Mycena polygramma]
MVSPSAGGYTPPNAPHTPLMRKAKRLASQTSPQFDPVTDSPLESLFLALFRNLQDLRLAVSSFPCSTGVPLHAIRLEIQAKEQVDKATPKIYGRQFGSYDTWFNAFQLETVAKNPHLVALPSMPIIASKVVPFLQIESTREKKKRGSTETIAGSSVGRSQISGVISALESYRLNSQHLYPDCPEAQIPLRNDVRIRQFESASKHDEPKRAEKAQTTKAAGSSLDTYTIDELRKCASWCLTNFSGPKHVYLGLRDRTMLLLGAATAFEATVPVSSSGLICSKQRFPWAMIQRHR